MTYHVQFLLLVRQPLFDRAALPLTQTSWVLPPLSVGKMTLRLYGALNYSHGLSKGPSFGTGRGDGTQPSPIRPIEMTNRVDRMSLSYGNYGALRAHMKAPDAQLETMSRDSGTRQRALG